jgi:hypothetical protein
MIKAIIGLIVVVVPALVIFGQRYLSRRAKKDRLLAKIRKLENEKKKYPVGSPKWNDLDAQWMLHNEQWGDIARKS